MNYTKEGVVNKLHIRVSSKILILWRIMAFHLQTSNNEHVEGYPRVVPNVPFLKKYSFTHAAEKNETFTNV